MTPCRPVRPWSRRWLGLAARAVAGALDGVDSGDAEAALDRLGEVEVPPVEHVVAEAGAEGLGDLLSHLVATRPDSRPDRRDDRAGDRLYAGFEDSVYEAAPADMEDDEARLPVPSREDDRKAVGGEQPEGPAGPLRPDPIPLLEVPAGGDDSASVGLEDSRPVHLPGHRRGLGIRARGGAQTPPVLDDALGLVLREDAEVEGVEVALAHTALPRREGGVVRGAEIALDHVHASTRTSMTSRTKRSASVMSRENWSWKTMNRPKTTTMPYWSKETHRA